MDYAIWLEPGENLRFQKVMEVYVDSRILVFAAVKKKVNNETAPADTSIGVEGMLENQQNVEDGIDT